jgi:hypothetical protein
MEAIGHWINHGLPQYILMDYKPEDGCEIQNAARGRIGIMIRLKLVKAARVDAAQEEQKKQQQVGHGTKVILKLVQPWNQIESFLRTANLFCLKRRKSC